MSGPISERFGVRVGDFATRTLSVDGDGPPILLLHGFSDSADTWRPVLACLHEAGRGALAVDLPHFGHAGRPEGPLLPTLEAFTAALFDEHPGAVVAGNSLGGMLSLRAAGAGAPAGALVPIGPAGLGLQPWVGAVHRVGRPLLALARAPLPMRQVRSLTGLAFARLACERPVDPDVLARYAGHFRSPADLARVLRLARETLETLPQHPIDAGRIQAPILMIWGSRDRLCPVRGSKLVIQGAPHARLEVMPGLGHCTQLDAPQAVARLIAAEVPAMVAR